MLRRGTLYLTRMPGFFRSFFREAGRILYAGFPSFVMEYSIGIVTFFINRAIVRERFGSQGFAAFLIIGYLMLLYLTVFLGMAEGLQPVFSLLAGKKDVRGLRDLQAYSRKVFLVLGIVLSILCVGLSRPFYSIFNSQDTALILFAAKRSVPFFLLLFPAGGNILQITIHQASGQTGTSLLLAALRSFLLPPVLLFVLPALAGPEALWCCQGLAEIGTALAALGIGRGLAVRKAEK